MRIVTVIFLILIMTAVSSCSEPETPETPPPPSDGRYNVPNSNAPARGSDKPAVTIVSFSDYQCPFSRKAYRYIRALQKRYPGKIRHVFRQFPLDFHDSALPAARAAAAAYLQGKFWDMHDALFTGELTSGIDYFETLARSNGLNAVRFSADYYSSDVTEIIDRDRALGARFGVRGTPTMYINGIRFAGISRQRFISLVERELANGEELLRKGEDVYARTAGTGADRYVIPKKSPPEISDDIFAVPVPKNAFVRGAEDAAVTVISFFDLQCPISAMNADVLEQIHAGFPHDVRIVYVHRPRDFHRYAHAAARAVESARIQGKFMDMYRLLFRDLRTWRQFDTEAFADFIRKSAEDIGLDVDKFTRDMNGRAVKTVIKKHRAIARQAGVHTTPVTFINGRMIPVPKPLSLFSSVVREERKKAAQMLEQGVPAGDIYHLTVSRGRITIAADPSYGTSDSITPRGDEPTLSPSGVSGRKTVVLFTDFTCRHCRTALDVLTGLADEYRDTVEIIIKHRVFPKPRHSHRTAVFAAAVNLAYGSDAFLLIARELFNRFDILASAENPRPLFMKILADNGLDNKPVLEEIRSLRAERAVLRDMHAAARAGIDSVPSLVVGTDVIRGFSSRHSYRKKIRQLMNTITGGPHGTKNNQRDIPAH